jgi:uncharacterized protein (TIGR03083 family)
MVDTQYRDRIDALMAVWRRWADVGEGLSEEQWSAPTRCTGWDVAALYAHVGMFPRAIVAPSALDDVGGEPVTAVDILRGFNALGGVAHQMAEQVADSVVSLAAGLGRPAFVALFADDGPRAIAALRGQAPDARLHWPGVQVMTTWVEAVRIVLMESVVHLLDVLDVLDALDRPPDVPAAGLRETAHLLADLADPVEFIDAATGRSATVPLPVLR